MALNNAAADAALDVYVASIDPPPADGGTAIRESMQPLFRAIYSGIVSNAVVSVSTNLTAPATTCGAGAGVVTSGAGTGTGTVG